MRLKYKTKNAIYRLSCDPILDAYQKVYGSNGYMSHTGYVERDKTLEVKSAAAFGIAYCKSARKLNLMVTFYKYNIRFSREIK